MLKYITLFIYSFLLLTISAQEKNYKVCKEMINANDDISVKTIFTLSHEISSNELKILRNGIYSKLYNYYVGINQKHNEIYIFHMSSIHFEDLKILAQPSGLELNFISTTPVVFKHESQLSSIQTKK